MPNWTRNTIKYQHKQDFKTVLSEVSSDYSDFDFNKIIPEPLDIENCPADCITNEHSHIEEDKDRPWFDWYAWHNKFWGVKWNASEVYVNLRKLEVSFDTPWTAPEQIINVLSKKYPEIPFKVTSYFEGFEGHVEFIYDGKGSEIDIKHVD